MSDSMNFLIVTFSEQFEVPLHGWGLQEERDYAHNSWCPREKRKIMWTLTSLLISLSVLSIENVLERN